MLYCFTKATVILRYCNLPQDQTTLMNHLVLLVMIQTRMTDDMHALIEYLNAIGLKILEVILNYLDDNIRLPDGPIYNAIQLEHLMNRLYHKS